MSLKQLHETSLRMRAQNSGDRVTTPTLERTIRDQWRQRTDLMFQRIPATAIPFAEAQAWHVFDNHVPGPLEQFLVAVAASEKQGHTIKIDTEQLRSLFTNDLSRFASSMRDLTDAWKQEIDILVRYNTSGIEITFLAI